MNTKSYISKSDRFYVHLIFIKQTIISKTDLPILRGKKQIELTHSPDYRKFQNIP